MFTVNVMTMRDDQYISRITSINSSTTSRQKPRRTAKTARMEDLESEAFFFRRVALFSIVVSVVSLMTAVLAVPLLYAYLQTTVNILNDELDFCDVRLTDLHLQFDEVSCKDYSSTFVYKAT